MSSHVEILWATKASYWNKLNFRTNRLRPISCSQVEGQWWLSEWQPYGPCHRPQAADPQCSSGQWREVPLSSYQWDGTWRYWNCSSDSTPGAHLHAQTATPYYQEVRDLDITIITILPTDPYFYNCGLEQDIILFLQ